ncbi:PREDICTED: guanine nucleotide-binding protein G(I)/G(S)/G(O) subunit gamma-13 [Pygoscelis adeliae]|uniref:guanine nucleotide-binding protein G(I)/G(S)/G(O) subunit gamma-13 n=1 Tax=Pygoscelis adeliae TaxID=9238 RepID=UPI0004F4ED73|nr:PREDICTED: guanine nucleotide-binding protein G(I)/G(S)/G(O) subunit gamma-13 [Pygoscelis adeliae]
MSGLRPCRRQLDQPCINRLHRGFWARRQQGERSREAARARPGRLAEPAGTDAAPAPRQHLFQLRFVKWIEDGIPEDPFLNPELMKNNPWVEKGKCTIL